MHYGKVVPRLFLCIVLQNDECHNKTCALIVVVPLAEYYSGDNLVIVDMMKLSMRN